MYILWNDILLPLLVILGILLALTMIIFVFAISESLIYTKIQEWKLRHGVKKALNESCDKLKEDMNDIFDDVLNNVNRSIQNDKDK